MQNINDLEDMLLKFLGKLPVEHRLSGLTPEQRVTGLTPEQRVTGLTPEQRVALSRELLRGLPKEYMRSLPQDLQVSIHGYLERPSSNP